MKTFIKGILISTALCILSITIVGSILGAIYFKFSAIFELFFINTIMHLLLYSIAYVNFKGWLVQVVVELSLLNTITLLSRHLFGWGDYFSIELIILITFIVYISTKIIDGIYVKNEIADINQKIKRSHHINE